MTNEVNGSSLLRMIGFMAICVGAVWALQILAFGENGNIVARLSWVLGAASIAGAGAGLIFAASTLPQAQGAGLRA